MFLINSSLSDLISPILSEARNCGDEPGEILQD